jgi:aurora kinase
MNKQPKGRFTEHQTADYIAQITSALRYLHGKNIMHRDVKPENILGSHSEIKLADYRYSVHSESGFRSTVCGTLDYLSPEVAVMLLKPDESQEFYTKAIDQWSLGVLTYELLVGKLPFEMKDAKGTQKRIANFKGKGIEFPGHVSKGAEELIREVSNVAGWV